MLTKLIEWSRRMNHPTMALAPLGFASEYWQGDPRRYEGYEQLQQRYKSLGRKVSRSYVAGEFSRHLLSEVLVAAGGIEGALMRLRASIAELRAWVDQTQMKAQPGVPYGLLISKNIQPGSLYEPPD